MLSALDWEFPREESKLGWAIVSNMLSNAILFVNAITTHKPCHVSATTVMCSVAVQQLLKKCNKRWKYMHLELMHVRNVLCSSFAKKKWQCKLTTVISRQPCYVAAAPKLSHLFHQCKAFFVSMWHTTAVVIGRKSRSSVSFLLHERNAKGQRPIASVRCRCCWYWRFRYGLLILKIW